MYFFVGIKWSGICFTSVSLLPARLFRRGIPQVLSTALTHTSNNIIPAVLYGKMHDKLSFLEWVKRIFPPMGLKNLIYPSEGKGTSDAVLERERIPVRAAFGVRSKMPGPPNNCAVLNRVSEEMWHGVAQENSHFLFQMRSCLARTGVASLPF